MSAAPDDDEPRAQPDAGNGGEQPPAEGLSEEELRAAYEAELSRITVTDMTVTWAIMSVTVMRLSSAS